MQCRPVIDIHVILFAGDGMDSYFVESVICDETMVKDWVSLPSTSSKYLI